MVRRVLNFCRIKAIEEFYSLIWRLDLCNVRQENLSKLYSISKDKEICLILGNGKSLSRIENINLDKCFVMASNSFHLFSKKTGIFPDLYVIEDDLAIKNNINDLLDLKDYFSLCVPLTFKRSLDDYKGKKIFLNYYKAYGYPQWRKSPKFSMNLENGIYFAETVTYKLLEIACALKFKKVILAGVDLDYKIPESAVEVGRSKYITVGKDINHFDDEYNSGKEWYMPNIEQMKSSIQYACKHLYHEGAKLYNLSDRCSFKYVDQITPELLKNKFEELRIE